MAATRPLKKKKDNEADLKESRMTVEDRLTFMTAKKAELQSIFENGVWQLELEPEKASESRILKARFVLKGPMMARVAQRPKPGLCCRDILIPTSCQEALRQALQP